MDFSVVRSNILAPNLPWNVWKEDELGPAIMNFMRDHEPFYKRWAQKWHENFRYLYGNTDLKFSKRFDFAVDVDFLRTKTPSMAVKSATNIVRVVDEALASLLYGTGPQWEVEAANDSALQATRLSAIVDAILQCYFERMMMDVDLAMAANIMPLYGQIGSVTDWQRNGGMMMDIPQYQKQIVPIFTDWMATNPFTGGLLEVPTQSLGADGMPVQEERWIPVLDQLGKQIVNKVMAGDVRNRIKTPFEYRRAIGSHGMHTTNYAETIDLMDYDQFMDEMRDVPGATKNFKTIQPIVADPATHNFAITHFMRMQTTTPPCLSEYMGRSPSFFRSSMFRHKVLVVNHYDKPHSIKWPYGRRVVVVNGQATHVTTPDYIYPKPDGWHPLSEAMWMRIAPSSMAPGPINDIVVKNREINMKDSFVATSMRRNMGSQLLIKSGQGIDADLFTGEPGSIIEVPNPLDAAMWLHDQQPINTAFSKYREMDKEDAYEMSGAGDALRGQPSAGSGSGYQEKQREEREEKRLRPQRDEFERFTGKIGEKTFFCVKQNVSRLDDGAVAFLKRSAIGRFTVDDAVTVLTTPIDPVVDIKVKKNSMAVKSKASQQATIQELSQNPAVAARLQQDAGVLDEYLKFFDIDKPLRDKSAAHRDRAKRENQQFQDLLKLGADTHGIKWPTVCFEDDDDIHLNEHGDWFIQNADEILGNPQYLERFLMHQNTHRVQRQEKLAEVMAGSGLQVPGMMMAAAQQQPPTPQMIAQDSMIRQQRQQEAGPAQAPKQPAAAPGGPKQVDPQAPSENTPPARRGGPPK